MKAIINTILFLTGLIVYSQSPFGIKADVGYSYLKNQSTFENSFTRPTASVGLFHQFNLATGWMIISELSVTSNTMTFEDVTSNDTRTDWEIETISPNLSFSVQSALNDKLLLSAGVKYSYLARRAGLIMSNNQGTSISAIIDDNELRASDISCTASIAYNIFDKTSLGLLYDHGLLTLGSTNPPNGLNLALYPENVTRGYFGLYVAHML